MSNTCVRDASHALALPHVALEAPIDAARWACAAHASTVAPAELEQLGGDARCVCTCAWADRERVSSGGAREREGGRVRIAATVYPMLLKCWPSEVARQLHRPKRARKQRGVRTSR